MAELKLKSHFNIQLHKSMAAVSLQLLVQTHSHPRLVHAVLIATPDHRHHRTCPPACNCLSHVLFDVCFRHMYEDQKTRSAIFEGGEEQSAASLISKCSHGDVRLSSPAQLSCSHAGRFAIQPPSLPEHAFSFK